MAVGTDGGRAQRGIVAGGRVDEAIGKGGVRPELADPGRLFRRGLAAVIRAARRSPEPGVADILEAHLGREARSWPVVGEVAGVVGVANFEHRMLSLGDLLVGQGRLP